jgi:dCTP deaminase
MSKTMATPPPGAPVPPGEIIERIFTDDPARRIVITPWTGSPIQDFTVDVRLGTKFIELRKSSTPYVDPLEIEPAELRLIQSKIEIPFGESYTLHPRQLVLSATLEYLALPPDLGAYVVTRSTYGRLGLITATAIYAHPGYRGCLTLEMVNYGDVPLRLYPGLRVAQLVFHHIHGKQVAGGIQKYALATEPEFPKIDKDADRITLRKLRTK